MFSWSPPFIHRTLPSNILVSLHLRAERTHTEAFLYNLFKFNLHKKKVAGAWCGRSNGVLVLSLPLRLVVVGVAAVQLVEHLPHSRLQSGGKKLDILLHAQVQDLINPLC